MFKVVLIGSLKNTLFATKKIKKNIGSDVRICCQIILRSITLIVQKELKITILFSIPNGQTVLFLIYKNLK